MSIVSDFFDGRGKFIPMKLVKHITDNELENRLVTPITSRGGDTMWHYKNQLGIYKPNGISYIRNEVEEILGDRSKSAHVNEVVFLALIKTYIQPDEFVEDPNLIVMENGVLEIDTMKLRDHNHMDYAKAAIPVIYDPEAKCPLFIKFLERVASPYMEFLQEWTGYHLLKDQRHQRFVILLGDGDNGKSTYLDTLTSFLGKENVANQSLYRITSNRFALAELYGKLANIAADIGPGELKYTGALKIATGEDRGSAERKYMDPFNFMNYAKLTFSCNQLPKTPDETLAFHKRHIVLIFNVIIPPEEQDKQLKEKLRSPEELSGIFNWALEGLKRILERHGFNEPTTIQERKTQYRRLSNPVLAFVDDCLIEDLEGYERKLDVYRAFTSFCKDAGYAAISDSVFFKELKKHIYFQPGQRKIKGRKGIRVITGLTILRPTQGTQGTQGPILSFSQVTHRKKEGVPCVGCVSRVDEPPLGRRSSSAPKDQLSKLIADAIKILEAHKGRMGQPDLFKALIELGHHFVPSNLALRGDSRFKFMGVEVSLKNKG